MGGPAIAVAYLTKVLPLHAAAEVGSTAQYGLTWALHALRASDAAALAGGQLSYALMFALGLFAARYWSLREHDAAFAVLVPPAFVVFGGTFVHYTQIMIAIPAAALLALRARSHARVPFAAAVFLLAVPWAWVLGQPLLMPVYAAAACFLARSLFGCTWTAALRISLTSAFVSASVVIAGFHFGAGLPAHAHGIVAGHGLAQDSWGQFIRTQRASGGAAWWIAKAPTWLGLALLTLGCAYAIAKENFEAPVAVKQVPVAS